MPKADEGERESTLLRIIQAAAISPEEAKLVANLRRRVSGQAETNNRGARTSVMQGENRQ
jgi:hypothetical protein